MFTCWTDRTKSSYMYQHDQISYVLHKLMWQYAHLSRYNVHAFYSLTFNLSFVCSCGALAPGRDNVHIISQYIIQSKLYVSPYSPMIYSENKGKHTCPRQIFKILQLNCLNCCIYPKYWDTCTLCTCQTNPKIWNSPFYYLFMGLRYCCM